MCMNIHPSVNEQEPSDDIARTYENVSFLFEGLLQDIPHAYFTAERWVELPRQPRPLITRAAKNIGNRILKQFDVNVFTDFPPSKVVAWSLNPLSPDEHMSLRYDIEEKRFDLELSQSVGPYFMVNRPIVEASLTSSSLNYEKVNEYDRTSFKPFVDSGVNEVWWMPMDIPLSLLPDNDASINEKLHCIEALMQLTNSFFRTGAKKVMNYERARRTIFRGIDDAFGNLPQARYEKIKKLYSAERALIIRK